MKPIPALYERISYQTGRGITTNGQLLISDMLRQQLGYPFYDGPWDESKGKAAIPKQVAKWYYDELDIKLSNELRTAIGNIVEQHRAPLVDIGVEFVDDFNWKKGEFGDEACFINHDGGYTTQTMSLMEAGGLAARFYEGDAGVGRCWMLRDTANSEHWGIFNGYWKTEYSRKGTDPLPRMASILADILDCRATKVQATINAGSAYINSDRAFILHPKGVEVYTGWHTLDSSRKHENCLCKVCNSYDSDRYSALVWSDGPIRKWMLICDACYVNMPYCSRDRSHRVANDHHKHSLIYPNGTLNPELFVCTYCVRRSCPHCSYMMEGGGDHPIHQYSVDKRRCYNCNRNMPKFVDFAQYEDWQRRRRYTVQAQEGFLYVEV